MMNMKIDKILLITLLLSCISMGYAAPNKNSIVTADRSNSESSSYQWPTLNFYVGFGMGYGDTDWSQLVNKTNNPIVQIAAPSSASSGGMTAEAFFGYRLSSYFALEARFVHYPQATVHFNHIYESQLEPYLPPLPFPLPHNLIPSPYHTYDFSTDTADYALVAKFFVPLSRKHHVDMFADFGVNYTTRQDVVTTQGVYSPTFGAGADWRFAPRFVTSFEFEYAPGTGVTSETPAAQYMPFIFNLSFRLAYLFNL
tara:strand:- start:32846 stop:33610 length:765 start_codon:yes stop_codon:yes gene_type:complete